MGPEVESQVHQEQGHVRDLKRLYSQKLREESRMVIELSKAMGSGGVQPHPDPLGSLAPQ